MQHVHTKGKALRKIIQFVLINAFAYSRTTQFYFQNLLKLGISTVVRIIVKKET